MNLTAIVLTFNEADHIGECLRSLWFADEVIVFDSYSTDETVTIAEANNAHVIQHAFLNYASQRNAALAATAQADWALFVDADERVTGELAEEILEVIHNPDYAAWRVPRHNYIFGRLTLGAGWYPDYQTRLLRLGQAYYDPDRQVHEVVLVRGAEGTLTQPLIHYNYTDVAQFHRKQKSYSAYDAQILFEQEIQPKPQNYLLQPLRQFWWRFVTLKGYEDGVHGLRLSLLMAWYELRKYRVLRRLWANQGEPG